MVTSDVDWAMAQCDMAVHRVYCIITVNHPEIARHTLPSFIFVTSHTPWVCSSAHAGPRALRLSSIGRPHFQPSHEDRTGPPHFLSSHPPHPTFMSSNTSFTHQPGAHTIRHSVVRSPHLRLLIVGRSGLEWSHPLHQHSTSEWVIAAASPTRGDTSREK